MLVGYMTAQLAAKYTHLKSILRNLGSVVIGYSGGVDSTLLLKVATDELGKYALAVIGKSEAYPMREFQEAIRIAESIDARYMIVATEETDVLKFRENPPDRCYYCKKELFSKLKAIAEEEKLLWVADGTITDDMSDFRPGMKAKRENNVRSPLLEAGFSKADVRELSKHLGLPTWDKGAFACLSSRFPYGMSITKEELTKIDAAETLLYEFGFKCFRVRYHDDKTARIEVSPDEIARLLDVEIRSKVVTHLKTLGFTYITLDLQGYRTGSMNDVLSKEVKEAYLK